MPGQTPVFQTLLDGCPGAGFVVTGDAKILWANPEAERAFGSARPDYAQEGLVGFTMQAVMPCALGARIAHKINAGKGNAAKAAARFSLDLHRDTGPGHSADVMVWPVRPEGGEQLWVVLVLEAQRCEVESCSLGTPSVGTILCTGAAALRATEAARRKAQESAEILRISTQHSNLAPWTYSPERGEGTLSPHFATMLGHGADPPMDLRRFTALIHPDDQPQAIADFQALKGGEIDSYCHDVRVRRADGSWAWVTSRGHRIERTGGGSRVLLCGSLTDISERKAAETRLAEALDAAVRARKEAQEREEMLRTSGLCAGVGHFSFIPEVGEGWTAEETYRLFGFEPGEFPSTNEGWRSLIHPDDRPGAVAAMDALQEGRSELYAHEHRRQHKDGSYHWYHSVARRVDRSAQGLPSLLAGAIICVDHAKEVQQCLAEAADAARQARERLDTLADNAPGALFEYRKDRDGGVSLPYFSAKLPGFFGVTRAEIEAETAAILRHVPVDKRQSMLQGIDHAGETGTKFGGRIPVDHPERGRLWMHVSALPFRQSDASMLWSGTVRDVTAHVETENRAAEAAEEVRKAHDRLASIAGIAPVGLYEVKSFPDGVSAILYVSPCFKELLGLNEGNSVLVMSRTEAARSVDLGELSSFLICRDAHETHLALWNTRFCIHHPQRGEVWLSNAVTPKTQPDGSVVWTGALHDVTADVLREAELRKAHRLAENRRIENEWQALHDGLTGLPNRRYHDQVLARRIAEAASDTSHSCTLIRLDLDHFKHVNDTLGHGAGDMVLRRLADVLRTTLRSTDFAARIGGDEFSVILGPGLRHEHARDIVQCIQARLMEPLMYEGRQCRFGASFGIAEAEDLSAMGPEIQFFADAALYRAKEAGRNRMEFFTPELLLNLRQDRELAGEIQEGLDRDEFEHFFQAQVSAQDRRLTGVEALLRWRHPRRGLLAPAAFMHVAEQLRLVPEIDRVVMEKSRGALARWRAQGLFVPKISFNVSSGRMHDPDVVRAARAIAEDETRVTFELLESILVEEESDVFRFHLDAVREAGIDIEIDDFGSGHASIIGLMQIAPSALKIDRRIVAPLGRDPQAGNLIRAIIEIAETLDISTVAEGVETEMQAEMLRELGCDVLQGFLFSMPLSADDFAAAWHHIRKRA
jgi:diguanylate cyclase (GGDEF)-like protein/PAS domain S-box-containing protein